MQYSLIGIHIFLYIAVYRENDNMHDGVFMYDVYVRDYINANGHISGTHTTHITHVMYDIYFIYNIYFKFLKELS